MRLSTLRTPTALAAFVLLAACSYGGTTPPAAPPPAAPPPVIQPDSSSAPVNAPTDPKPKAKAASVTIQNFAFAPASLSFKKGTTVTWTNNDTAPHRIEADGAFPGSATLNQGQSYSFTFNDTGTFPYYCAIHTTMKGSVEVLP